MFSNSVDLEKTSVKNISFPPCNNTIFMPIKNRDIQCIYISFIYEHNRMCILRNSGMLIDMKCCTTDRYCQSKPDMNEAGITKARVTKFWV